MYNFKTQLHVKIRNLIQFNSVQLNHSTHFPNKQTCGKKYICRRFVILEIFRGYVFFGERSKFISSNGHNR